MTPRLAASLAALESAFAPVAAPTRIEACPCCRSADNHAALLTRPRHLMTGADLGAYTLRAMSTVGSVADFRYLAGRILQLLHANDPEMPDIEVVYGKLAHADWRSWPQADALAAVMDALWIDVLTHEPARGQLDGVLCALGIAETTIVPRLGEWGRLGDPVAIWRLHEFVRHHLRTRKGVILPANAYWDRTSSTHDELVHWLNGGPALGAVGAAFDRTDDVTTLELLAEIHTFLDRPIEAMRGA
ncbi:hypothetical protein ACWF82_07800 [Nocardia sp. NPDC055053]